MIQKNTVRIAAGMLIPAALFLAAAVPVFAQDAKAPAPKTTGTSATVHAAKLQQKEKTAADKAAAAITKRVEDLSSLETHINEMVHVGADVKSSLSASIESTIAAMKSLGTKISSDTDSATLKSDMQEITKGERVYMLVIPQTHILAAADRANTVVEMIAAMNTKLEQRVNVAQAAGKDISTITAAQADITTQLADAKSQIQAVIAGVSGLTPDGGDKTKMASNTAALKTARTALSVANKDLKAASADIKKITAVLKSFGEAKTTTTNTASTTENKQQ